MLKTKKGETVVLLGFTGMRIAAMTATVATKEEIHLTKTDGSVMIFDRKTGIQKNVPEGKEKYANKIVDPADAPPAKEKKAPTPPAKKEAKKEEAKKETKKEAPPAAKKDDKKVPPKKTKETVPPVEDDDDFGDDDEEYEEV